MTEKEADMLYDIIIPSIIIAALFIVNAVIFAIIMRYRRRRQCMDNDGIAEL
uniref:CSON009992 protein n=1 Tax=Culicoides sonorensis TaxID=179676 RepID=A0A336LLD9_CULSO